jgi:predicted transcriptional regulator
MKLTRKDITPTKTGYNASITLGHDELPAKVNKDTGELVVADMPEQPKRSVNKGKSDTILFEPNSPFNKTYKVGWKWLYYNTTPLEYKTASLLSLMAKPYTSSLKPLNDDMSIRDLAYELNISKSHVQKVMDKLFELGVYGKFEVVNADKEHTKYWVFNPFLVFTGRYIKDSVYEMFKDTHIAKLFQEFKELPCEDC